ncbi:NAD(P)/FAD-dependent oxidoreductase [Enterococcus lemanii]|uniref:NAD(P)/FAD-dependent oxidoreductase n=1 Tax=Enterococcus lemanii TaxID=1159752 RepID=A0ABV9MUU1_9ENTE|nr:FAD-dependent oxidoreductase [Enterococcus lemanii]MBM7708408.1 glycine/D-amino acid oxidase-like deaminating enzyme [Enterococcus lemanii]
MKKIAIIGGGIIGITLANYLNLEQFQVTLYDEGVGQATSASAGIISPWTSKRRNQKWYQLAKDGAAFFPKLVRDFHLSTDIYAQTGALILRKEGEFDSLLTLANERKKEAPELGTIQLLTKEKTHQVMPLLKPQVSLFLQGGARLNGQAYLEKMTTLAKDKGVSFIPERAKLQKEQEHWLVKTTSTAHVFDLIVITAGPSIKNLLSPLGYFVDVRPQKGQLIEFQTNYLQSTTWPVVMLDGEADLIPYQNGKILLGATHENEALWDLTPTKEAFTNLWQISQKFLASSEILKGAPYQYRVGTRAYTSDFAPFFGKIPNDPSLFVASGLGSSGLTIGPLIGYILAQELNNNRQIETKQYQKELETYIKKQP